MRKLFYLCFVVIILLATGCKNDDVSPVKQIHLELSHDNISINAGGGSASVTVYCNDSWEVYGSCDWCSPSLRSGMANDEDGTVVNFDAKESYAPREAIFYFMCGEICLELKVTQEQKNVIFADEQNIFNIPASGGVALIEYKTNVLCGVVIPTEAENWISLTSTRALRDESMSLYIAPNETYDSRSATIMIVAIGDTTLCAEYTINQAQKDVILAGEDNKFIVSSDGGDVNIDFETNVNYKVNIPSNARDWITLVEPTRGVFPHNIVLRVAMNKTYDKRSAVISITKSGASNPTVEYTIEQMQNDDIVFEGDVLLTPAKGGSVVLDYQANIDCEVIIPDEVKDWISIEPQTRGLEQYSVTLVFAPNDSFDERTATIKVEGETVSRDIEVKQMGIERVLSLTPSTLDLPLDATTVTVEVETNIDYEVVIPEDCDWITIPESDSASENKVIFAFTENPTIYSRNTEILFKGDGKDVVLPVIQRGDEGIIILNEEYIVDGQETVLSIEFGSNFDYTVYIPDTCDWLSLPETRAVVQNHTIDFVLTKNPSIDSRSAEVLFSDTKGDVSKSVTITQLGSPITCVVPNDNEILYKTTDGEKLNISETGFGFATVVVSHTYEDGVGRITYSSNITKLGNELFYDCSTLEQVAIPDSVTTIGDSAFCGCSSLTSITIPDSVTTIGDYAFYNCSSLTNVTIPDSVTTIGSSAFQSCSSLTSVTIPDSVTTIGYRAFYECSSLTSVTIPDSVTTIGWSAFESCSSLINVTIGSGVTSIGDDAFRDCTGELIINSKIVEKDYDIGNYPFKDGWLYGSKFTSLIIGNGVTTIGNSAFRVCGSLTSVTIPDSVTEIGSSAFQSCGSLTSVTIPDSVTSIGNDAFCYCRSLTSVTIGSGVTSIGWSAFRDCTGELIINGKIVEINYDSGNYPSKYGWLDEAKFTSLTIGNSVTSIGKYTFYNCTSLTRVTIGNGVTSIGEQAFSGCTGELIINSKIVEYDYDSDYYPSKYGWLKEAKFTKLTIGDSVTSIGEHALYKCTSLTSVTIGDSVTSIGDYAFEDCISLTSVTIPDSVTTIGGGAFSDCTSLKSITIPDSVTEIGSEAFRGCRPTSVILGSGVTSIGRYAFYGCTGELIVNCNIPSVSDIYWGAFRDSKFAKVTISNGVKSIGNGAFYDCTSLKSITIPDSVTTIGKSAFKGCSSLTSLTIPDSVKSIGYGAFNDCTLLKSLTIPNSVTSIEEGAFSSYEGWLIINCDIPSNLCKKSGVTKVTIGDSVKSIGEQAFYYCPNLTSVTIGSGVTSIGKKAFWGCTGELIVNSKIIEKDYTANDCPSSYWLNGAGFTELTIGDGIERIGNYAFYSCDSLTRVTIGRGVTSLGEDALYCYYLETIYCTPTTPPTLSPGTFNNFGYIYVPSESVDKYKSWWWNYANKIRGMDL